MRLIERTLLCLLFLAPAIGMAQETMGPLNGNAEVAKGWAERNFYHSKGAERSGDTLQLPFIDDFSVLSSPFPDQSKWMDKHAWINATMPLRPWTLGVATLDGLNEFGMPYHFGHLVESDTCDYLTSCPIDLSNTDDTVILSFYYEAQGLGNSPEPKDSLVVEMKDTAGEWHSVWRTMGYVLTDSTFNLVMLPILGQEYLYKGFQFRFMNYGTQTGSLDHWHIDYVKLDDDRTMADTLVQDVSFTYPNQSLLKSYNAVPWTHFLNDTTQVDNVHVMTFHNSALNNSQPNSLIELRNSNGVVLDDSDVGGASQMEPSIWCTTAIFSGCNTISTEPENISKIVDFNFPTNSPTIAPDSTFFTLTCSIDPNNSDPYTPNNDTIVFRQEFYNFYAYDDGSAENAYGILDVPLAMFAYKFNIYKPDVLRALQIYFNPVIDDASLLQRFKIKVWTGAQVPETVVYEDTEWRTPAYGLERGYYQHYFLEQPYMAQSGLLFIGIQQESGVMINVGLDRNRNSNTNMFYFLTEDWVQSTIPGSWMMRPTFGAEYSWTDVKETEPATHIGIYPNPADDRVSVSGADANDRVELLDAAGRVIMALGRGNGPFDLDGVRPGFYLVRVLRGNTVVGTQRLIKQ